MLYTYIVPGYGVPQDILKDLNMALYLRAVANYIFEQTVKHGRRPLVIFSGGPTDMRSPYHRNEAGEIYRWMKTAIVSRDFRKQFRTWKTKLETKSISTLENGLFCARLVPAGSRVTVFSEFTRAPRWVQLLKLAKMKNATVIPIDFDASPNRYRSYEDKEKEWVMMQFDRWAMKNSQNLRQHHEFFKRRIEYLRSAGPKNHIEAVHRFWKDGAKLLPPEIRVKLKRHV